jgi:hypothetical protein
MLPRKVGVAALAENARASFAAEIAMLGPSAAPCGATADLEGLR